MFRAMAIRRFLCDLYCCHVSITTGALGSPGLLLSFSIITITISLHITIILTMALMYFYISFFLHPQCLQVLLGRNDKGQCCRGFESKQELVPDKVIGLDYTKEVRYVNSVSSRLIIIIGGIAISYV